MSEWKEYKLSEVYEFSSGLSKPKEEFGFGYGFLSYMSIFDNYFVPDELDSLVNSTEKERQSCSIKRGDVFLTRTSETDEDLGVSSVALKDYSNATFNGFTKRLRPYGVIEVLPEYAGFYFRSPRFRATVGGMSSMTTRASLNNSMLSELPIIVPSIETQTSIVNVLFSLHKKIDLLHRQNKTLEQLAETLFRQWFVEEAGEDWREVSLFDAVEILGGGTPKTENAEYWDGNIHWISGKDITPNHKQFIVSTEKQITQQGLDNSAAKILPKYSTVISTRGTVGKVAILASPMAFSQTNYGIVPKVNGCYFFTYLLIEHSVEELQSAAYGSVFDTITTNTFKDHKICLPDETAIQSFELSVKPYFDKMLSNTIQIQTLSHLRNALLPKLMSGEIMINI